MSDDIKVGLIGGSGLGELLRSQTDGHRHEIDTPFGKPSDVITETHIEGVPVCFLSRHGAGHLFNPSQVPYRANIFALKTLGVTHIIASGAVGSLREEFKPRDLVIPEQIIDKTRRPATFFDHAAVHVEFAEPFDPILRQILIEQGAVADIGFKTHNRGCYVAMEGPAFSTRAESLMHRLWGGDLIGMTCMPEAKLAREAEIGYALIALVTDYDCWRPPARKDGPVDPAELMKEIIANLQSASDNAVNLIRRSLRKIAEAPEALKASPALNALKLAIWSDKKRIAAEQILALGPIWKKYFESAQ